MKTTDYVLSIEIVDTCQITGCNSPENPYGFRWTIKMNTGKTYTSSAYANYPVMPTAQAAWSEASKFVDHLPTNSPPSDDQADWGWNRQPEGNELQE
jgi:hypothetical protein